MSHTYTEDQLVEQPAIGLFAMLGWRTMTVLDETFGADGIGSECVLSPPAVKPDQHQGVFRP